ncbi:MAG: hypothetical protein H0X29_07010 [Parachlamydiaceae bacterium]|nr:hypothetical protein [Parachlamydiaceae bacterium]
MFTPVDPIPPAYHFQVEERYTVKSECYSINNEELKTKLYELYSKTDQSSSYQLTISLLLSSQLGDVELYTEVLKKIYTNLGLTFKTTPEEFQSIVAGWEGQVSFNIWLLGRVLVSADNMQDKHTGSRVASLMHSSLTTIEKVDPFSTWAWGYLAAHYASDKKEYPYYRIQMLESTEALKKQAIEKEKDNVQWALRMDILAAGNSGDRETYNKLLQEFKEWTGKETISKAILTIPKEDFTAWALAIVRIAAAKVKDIDTYQELALTLEQAIKDSPSEQDKLLAEVNNLLSACFI